ncbi:MAG: ROK family protein [Firmicutes bacterium]|nr:ROK family protein [Bacillota bacterium]
MVRMTQEELQDPALDGVSFMNLVAQGNPKASAVLDTCLEALAKGLFNIQIINDLDTIVIGGGISENSLYIQRLQEKLTSFYEAFPFPIPRANLVASKSGNDANLKGALINFYKEHK